MENFQYKEQEKQIIENACRDNPNRKLIMEIYHLQNEQIALMNEALRSNSAEVEEFERAMLMKKVDLARQIPG